MPASAETYRWIEKDGKLHFGSAVPPEYSHLPYDVISKSGLVIGRIEPYGKDAESIAALEKNALEIENALAMKQEQSDRMLLIKYKSEEAIQKELGLELEQVGFDNRLIEGSFENSKRAIVDKVRLAADQQRAGIPVSDAQTAELRKLYRALEIDRAKLAGMDDRIAKVKARFDTELLRYRQLVIKYNQANNRDSSRDVDPSEIQWDQN